MKIIHTIFLTFCSFLLIVLIVLSVNVLNDATITITDKTNTVIQGIYTFITVVLVILTFNVLLASKEQYYQSVKPDVVLDSVDLLQNNELDITLINTGRGKAYNITLNIYKKKTKTPFFTEKVSSLDVIGSQLEGPLYHIVNELIAIKEHLNHAGSSSSFKHEEIGIEFEVNLCEPYTNYYNIIIIIQFEDAYHNRYKNSFELEYDKEELEYSFTKESSARIDNYLLNLKNIFIKQ